MYGNGQVMSSLVFTPLSITNTSPETKHHVLVCIIAFPGEEVQTPDVIPNISMVCKQLKKQGDTRQCHTTASLHPTKIQVSLCKGLAE